MMVMVMEILRKRRISRGSDWLFEFLMSSLLVNPCVNAPVSELSMLFCTQPLSSDFCHASEHVMILQVPVIFLIICTSYESGFILPVPRIFTLAYAAEVSTFHELLDVHLVYVDHSCLHYHLFYG